MAAVLRASGSGFDVDAFLADCPWRAASVFRRGEPRSPRTRPDGRRHDLSGLNVALGDAGMGDLAGQARDAVAFLTAQAAEVRRLVEFPGVTAAAIDFAAEWRDAPARSDRLPPDLVRAAGGCGVGLEVSHYRVSNDAIAGGEGEVAGMKRSAHPTRWRTNLFSIGGVLVAISLLALGERSPNRTWWQVASVLFGIVATTSLLLTNRTRCPTCHARLSRPRRSNAFACHACQTEWVTRDRSG